MYRNVNKKNSSLCPEYFLWYATVSWDASLVWVHLLTEEKLFVKHGVKFQLFSRCVTLNVCPEEEKIIREGEILRPDGARRGGKTMLDVSLCIPNWSAVAVIGVDTCTLTILGFTCDL